MIQFNLKTFSQLSPKDMYDVFKLRQDVFVVEQDCAYPDIDGMDLGCHHLIGRGADDTLVAYSRLVPATDDRDYVSVGRIIIHSSARGQGIGKTLVSKSIEHLQEMYPTHQIKISAQRHLIPFYEDVGFSSYGQVYLEDGIPHVGMMYGGS